MKVNIGCGHKLLDGFVNVDLENNWSDVQPDVVADVTKRLPFEDEVADEVHAYHVLEHLYRWQTEEVLAEWTRILKPGGLLVIELPCLDKIVMYIAGCMKHGVKVDDRLSVWGLFGDPNYKNEAMCHRWCFSRSELLQVLKGIGMVNVTAMPPKTHQPIRDIRFEATKP